jgi:hypothetical protein
LERSSLNAEKKVIEEDINNWFYAEDELMDLSKKLRGIVSSPLSFWKVGNLEIKQLLIGVRYWSNFSYSKKSGYRTSDSWLLNYFSKVFWDNNSVIYPGWQLDKTLIPALLAEYKDIVLRSKDWINTIYAHLNYFYPERAKELFNISK